MCFFLGGGGLYPAVTMEAPINVDGVVCKFP